MGPSHLPTEEAARWLRYVDINGVDKRLLSRKVIPKTSATSFISIDYTGYLEVEVLS